MNHSIPVTFNSQGLIWVVKYSSDIEDNGQTDWDSQTITIRAQLSPEAQLSTFIHEVFHTLNSTIDHALLDSLSNQFFQVIKENNLWRTDSKIIK